MKLDVDEFIRRFLLHILPKGFFKIRYYGIFSSRYRRENVENARQKLDDEQLLYNLEALEDGRNIWSKQNIVWAEILKMISEHENPNCPKCNKGRLRFAGIVPSENLVPD